MRHLFVYQCLAPVSRQTWRRWWLAHAITLALIGMTLLAFTAPLWWLAFLDMALALTGTGIVLTPISQHPDGFISLAAGMERWLGVTGSIVAVSALLDSGKVLTVVNLYPTSPLRQRLPIRRWIAGHYAFLLIGWILALTAPMIAIAVWESVQLMTVATTSAEIAQAWVYHPADGLTPLAIVIFFTAGCIAYAITRRFRLHVTGLAPRHRPLCSVPVIGCRNRLQR